MSCGREEASERCLRTPTSVPTLRDCQQQGRLCPTATPSLPRRSERKDCCFVHISITPSWLGTSPGTIRGSAPCQPSQHHEGQKLCFVLYLCLISVPGTAHGISPGTLNLRETGVLALLAAYCLDTFLPGRAVWASGRSLSPQVPRGHGCLLHAASQAALRTRSPNTQLCVPAQLHAVPGSVPCPAPVPSSSTRLPQPSSLSFLFLYPLLLQGGTNYPGSLWGPWAHGSIPEAGHRHPPKGARGGAEGHFTGYFTCWHQLFLPSAPSHVPPPSAPHLPSCLPSPPSSASVCPVEALPNCCATLLVSPLPFLPCLSIHLLEPQHPSQYGSHLRCFPRWFTGSTGRGRSHPPPQDGF
nr:PREDICTED: uncharacterized protein LOC106494256 [Apteryx mantelli mantelli]